METQKSERVVWIPLSKLKRWDRNYRVGNVEAITASIVRFGFNGAVRVWKDDVVIAGNHALICLQIMKANGAAAPLGIREKRKDWLIPCVDVTHLSRLEAEAFAIADNRTQELGENDPERLAALLQNIKAEDAELFPVTGYSLTDLEALLREVSRANDPELDVPDAEMSRAAELREKWQTDAGQLWQIGSHRLLCGDSREPSDVDRLMGGELADLCWTDPPYGVSYEGKTKDALTIENDGAEDLEALLNESFDQVDRALRPGAAIYVAHPAGKLSLVFGEAFIARWHIHQTLVWKKDSIVMGHSDYHYQHEPIYFGYKPGAAGRRGRGHSGWYGDDAQSSVLEFRRPKRSEEHPTQKPVELVGACIRNSSPPEGLLFEPFSGSGSTMAASEALGRRCYAVEIAPEYVAVTLERLSAMGLEPVLT